MQSIIRFALENRLLVVVLSLATLIGGYFAYRTLPVDATRISHRLWCRCS